MVVQSTNESLGNLESSGVKELSGYTETSSADHIIICEGISGGTGLT